VNTLPHQLRLSKFASFSLKANQRKEMAAGWLPDVFSARQPAPATYCTPHASGAIIGSRHSVIITVTRSFQQNQIAIRLN